MSDFAPTSVTEFKENRGALLIANTDVTALTSPKISVTVGAVVRALTARMAPIFAAPRSGILY